jgi:hypothetical protein
MGGGDGAQARTSTVPVDVVRLIASHLPSPCDAACASANPCVIPVEDPGSFVARQLTTDPAGKHPEADVGSGEDLAHAVVDLRNREGGERALPDAGVGVPRTMPQVRRESCDDATQSTTGLRTGQALPLAWPARSSLPRAIACTRPGRARPRGWSGPPCPGSTWSQAVGRESG